MPLKPTKQAHFHHTRVLYTPFGTKPATSLVLTSQPWAFLKAHLHEKYNKTRGDNRKRYKTALYFSDLAEEFYRSAESTQLPAKATLAYYGILNLVKCFISVRGKNIGGGYEHHGLSPSARTNADIKISKRARGGINVFHEFVHALSGVQPGQQHLSLSECLKHIPEVHEVAYRLGQLPDNQRTLLPIDIDILTDEDEKWLLSEIHYQKKHEHLLKTDKFLTNTRKQYFKEPREEENGKVIFRCKRRKGFKWSTFIRKYGNLCTEYEAFHLATLLRRDGYKFYCDLSNPKYHHLAYSYMALFHFGTVTRYNPSETEKLINGVVRPIVSELLSLTPKQFLYQLVSRITQNVCVVPFAKI